MKSKHVFFALAALLMLATGCRMDEPEPVEELPYASYGEEFTPGGALPVAQIASFSEDYVGQEVQVEGTVSEVCRNKGCWLMLDAGQDREIRVTFADYGFFVPKDISGQSVVLKGTVQRETLDEDLRRHYARDAGASPEEIEALTGPTEVLSIVADGVLIRRDGQAPASL